MDLITRKQWLNEEDLRSWNPGVLITSSAERLTIWACDYQIDTSKGDDACSIKFCHIPRDLLEERSLQDENSQGRGEAVRAAMHIRLKCCQGNFSCSWIFIAKIKFCKKAAS